MLKYLYDFIEKGAGDNLLGNNLLGNDLLGNNNLAYIDNNINMDTKVKSNLDNDITGNNLIKKTLKSILKTCFNRFKTKPYAKN